MRLLLLQNAENLFLTHNEEFLAIDLDLSPGILAKQNAVAGLDVEREDLAFVIRLALANGNHFTLLGLFLGGVRDDDATPDGFALFNAAHQDAVVKRCKAGSDGCCCSRHCVTSPSREGYLAALPIKLRFIVKSDTFDPLRSGLALSLFNC